ncbi:MAG: 30S ribosomal protein S16 [Gemmatimonadetes bacterium]|nr:30S ribosomal protein S16 [Gemmatimonadota bacterium]
MPLMIRLRRMGRKKQPHYRVVVADSDSPRDGRFVETLGYYKPLSHPARLVLDLERVEFWQGRGALASDTVRNLVRKARRGGDDSLALGEVDKEAEKQAYQEALAARRRAESEAIAKADAEAEAEAKPARAEKAAPEEPAAEEEAAPEAEAEEAAPEEPAAEQEAADEPAEEEKAE